MSRSLAEYERDWSFLDGARRSLHFVVYATPLPAIGLEPLVYTPDHFDNIEPITQALVDWDISYVWSGDHNRELGSLLDEFGELAEEGVTSLERWEAFVKRVRRFLAGPFSLVEAEEADYMALHYWSTQD